MRPTRTLSLLLCTALALAACGSNNSAEPTTTSVADTVPVSPLPSTLPPTTAVTTTVEATTTTTEPPVVYPLTGVPVTDGNTLITLRPAIVAKVGNYDSHPQHGLNLADIVYEEIINDNVSRFAAVYQSRGADLVGPIRSGRLQDVDLLGSLNGPILAWSGGNGTVTNEINNSDLVNMSPSFCGSACFRTNFAKAPYNLFFNIDAAWFQAPPGAGSPPAQFTYRAAGETVAGTPSAGVLVKMDSYRIDWTWNPASGLYERQQNGRPDVDRNGEVLTTDNIVVLDMVYLQGISNSPDAQSVGSGEAWAFTGGNVVHGTWSRADRTEPFTLTADDGSIIALTPGRTFVELPRAGGNVAPK